MELGKMLGGQADVLRAEQERRDSKAARKRAKVAAACKARDDQRKRAAGQTIKYPDGWDEA